MKSKPWKHRWFGLFQSEEDIHPELPKLEDFQYDIPPVDLEKIIDYLNKTPVIVRSMCFPINCPLCGDYKYDPASASYDGEWLWPTRLSHYVKAHKVILPEELMARIRSKNYIPTQEIPNDLDNLPWPRLN